jgi:enediyne biosynthesis protein E4
MVAGDYDGDGNLDVLLVGNSYSPEVSSGRDDAFIGLYLRGNGKGQFEPVKVEKSGFMDDNDAKGMVNLTMDDGHELIIVGNNSGKVRAFVAKQSGRLYQPARNVSYALVTLGNGKIYKHEFYYGSTYLSQSSRNLRLPSGARSVKIFDFKGNHKELDLDAMKNQASN